MTIERSRWDSIQIDFQTFFERLTLTQHSSIDTEYIFDGENGK